MTRASVASSGIGGNHNMHVIRTIQAAAVLAFGFASVIVIGTAALGVVTLAAITHGAGRLRTT